MDNDTLKRLSALAHRQMALEDALEQLERKRKEIQADLTKVSGEDIPTLLDEAGLSEVRLSDGTKIKVKDDLRISTTGKWREPINRWLRETGHDDILLNEITIGFGKGEDDQAAEAVAWLQGRRRDFDQKVYVRQPTLKSLINELLADGEEVPLEDLGAFMQRVTSLERPAASLIDEDD